MRFDNLVVVDSKEPMVEASIGRFDLIYTCDVPNCDREGVAGSVHRPLCDIHSWEKRRANYYSNEVYGSEMSDVDDMNRKASRRVLNNWTPGGTITVEALAHLLETEERYVERALEPYSFEVPEKIYKVWVEGYENAGPNLPMVEFCEFFKVKTNKGEEEAKKIVLDHVKRTFKGKQFKVTEVDEV